MRYIKPYKLFESDEKYDHRDLEELLNKTSHALNRMRSYAGQINRKSTASDKASNKLKDEYEDMFLYLIDDGWKYYREGDQFMSKIFLKKTIKRDDEIAEKEFEKVVREMNDIKSRFTAEGFNCHFMIFFDGKGQQENNPKTYKNDIYVYKGIGDSDWLKYSDDFKNKEPWERAKYFQAKVEFVYI